MASTSAPEASFVGAVLTGGRSRRMGRDKAFVEVDGQALAAVVAAALRDAGAARVLAVGGDGPALAGLGAGLEVVDDRHPGAGPLGGILTALAATAATGAPVAVVLACDLPFASAPTVRRVLGALAAHPTAVAAVPVVDGRLEPLHAAWRTSSLGRLEVAFADGERSPRRLLEALPVARVEGLDAPSVQGVNTPDELATARDVGQRSVRGQTGVMPDDTSRPEITTDELAALGDDAWVLDVRQPDEYESGHVPGAVLIPLDQLGARHGEVPGDRDVYVICKSGGRSAAAVDALNQAGLRTTNVAGGTMAWIDAGRPTVTGPDPR